MRTGFLRTLPVLLLTASLAQAQQWGPAYPGYYPPQYLPQYPPMGYAAYRPPLPVYYGNPYVAYQQPAAGTAEPEPAASAARDAAAAAVSAAVAAPACSGGECMANQPCAPVLENYAGNCSEHGWLALEYLYWWTRAAPSSTPLVTTGSAADPIPGAIGQPHTSVLFGNNDINLGAANGFRATIGAWLDSDAKLGLEVSGFILENATNDYSNSSSKILTVPINVVGTTFTNGNNAVPFNNPNAGTLNPLNSGSTNAAAIHTAGPYTGSVNDVYASQLLGGEFNLYYNLLRCPSRCGLGATLDVLGGFRYLRLDESLNMTGLSTDTTLGVTNTYYDHFQTNSQFFGGQVGMRADLTYCNWSLAGSLKVAFGVNDNEVTVGGNTVQTSGAGSTAYSGGIFSQPSNIGTHHVNNYSFAPQINLKIGYDLTPNVRVFVGYDFLYWTNVVRAGSQLDGSINPSQAYGGTLSGAANPAPLFNTSNYWAQGASAGILFRY